MGPGIPMRPALTSSLGVSRQQGYASDRDWERHKALITRLYRDENKTLKEVMAIMLYKHGFHATQKMFKTRIKKWDAGKNRRNTDSVRMWKVSDDQTGHSRAVLVFREHDPVDWEEVGRYLRLHPELQSRISQGVFEFTQEHGVVCRLPPADLALSMSVPDNLNGSPDVQLPEEIVHLIRTYIHGGVDAGILDPKPNSFGQLVGRNGQPAYERLVEWYERMRVAANWLGDDRAANGVRLINLCLNQLQGIILDQDFALVFALLHITFILPFRNREAGIIIVRFIAQLLHVMLGAHHPLTRIWTRLSRLSTSELLYALTTAMRMSLENLTKYVENTNPVTPAFVEQLMMLPGENPTKLLDPISSRVVQQRPKPTFFNIQFTIVPNVLSWYLHSRNTEGIQRVMGSLGARLAEAEAKGDDPRTYGPVKFMYCSMMSSFARMKGETDKERVLIEGAYDFFNEHFGPQNSWAITCMHRIVNWCKNYGDPKEAELWSQRIDEACSGWLLQEPIIPEGIK